MLNLITNAADAIEASPTSDREIVVATTLRAPTTVQLTVSDDGAGFAAEGPERLFDAFYTTKQAGMGLGLAISRTLVEAHGGKIWAERAYPGAVFNVTFPVAAVDGANVARPPA